MTITVTEAPERERFEARDDALLKEVYGNARYTLVSVPEDYSYGATAPAQGEEPAAEQDVPDPASTDPGGVGGVVGEPGSNATATP